MKDPSRFIERSQLEVSSSSRPLCHRQQEQQQQQEQAPGGSSAAGPGPAAREPDTYDDSEFYQLLLKELLEAGSGAGRPAPVRAAKKRKQVDRRASKGRKVRYHVHDKLVGFMTAGDHEAPPFAEQLFANLFGYSGSSAA
jgi:protein AATF/BFR2